jgi:hypothetical protein
MVTSCPAARSRAPSPAAAATSPWVPGASIRTRMSGCACLGWHGGRPAAWRASPAGRAGRGRRHAGWDTRSSHDLSDSVRKHRSQSRLTVRVRRSQNPPTATAISSRGPSTASGVAHRAEHHGPERELADRHAGPAENPASHPCDPRPWCGEPARADGTRCPANHRRGSALPAGREAFGMNCPERTKLFSPGRVRTGRGCRCRGIFVGLSGRRYPNVGGPRPTRTERGAVGAGIAGRHGLCGRTGGYRR